MAKLVTFIDNRMLTLFLRVHAFQMVNKNLYISSIPIQRAVMRRHFEFAPEYC